MNPVLLTVSSPKTGRTYRITPAEVRAFYEEHVLGATASFRDKALARLGRVGARACTLPLVGTVLLELFRPGGELVDVRMGPNLVVDAGRALVIDRLQGTPAVADYLAVGTGATAPAAGNTTLGTEIGTRVQGSLTQPTAYTDRCSGTFAAGNATGAITECGRLNASSSGTLLGRQTFDVINKAAPDSLSITYDITV
jgi:hypothetical protein